MKKQQLEQLIEEQKHTLQNFNNNLQILTTICQTVNNMSMNFNKKLQLQKTMHLQQQKVGLSNI